MHFLQISSQDVKGCMSTAEISKQLNLQSIRKHKYQIQPCCALTGEGYVKVLTCAVNKGYETITKDRIRFSLVSFRLYQGLEWIVNNIKSR